MENKFPVGDPIRQVAIKVVSFSSQYGEKIQEPTELSTLSEMETFFQIMATTRKLLFWYVGATCLFFG